MKLGRFTVKAERWPWQGYGWRSTGAPSLRAPLNSHAARFGGGWRFKFGVDVGTTGLILNLVFGSVRVNWGKR